MSFFATQLIGFGGQALAGAFTSLSPPSAVSTTFTYAVGAAEANLYDGNDATSAADPAGITTSTKAAYDFGSAKSVRRVRTITASANGFGNTITFTIEWSDTNLTSGFTAVATHVVPSGTSQETVTNLVEYGAHRYWRINYSSGTASGNAWLGELTFYSGI